VKQVSQGFICSLSLGLSRAKFWKPQFGFVNVGAAMLQLGEIASRFKSHLPSSSLASTRPVWEPVLRAKVYLGFSMPRNLPYTNIRNNCWNN